MAKRSKRKKADREVASKASMTSTFAQGLPAWLNRDWLWGLVLVLAVVLTYSPVWQAGFIWDDDAHVTANPCIIGPLGLKEIWTTSAARICPLVLTTFWVEHALWGLRPLPYHLVNVLLHGADAILLWQVLRSLQVRGAWFGAALWALHPVQVETVAWITELKNTQSGLFYLLTILFFVQGLKAKDRDPQNANYWNYVLTLLWAALAMASKSSTVVLPVVLILIAWWVEGKWRWRHLATAGPIFFMSLAAAAVSMWTQKLEGGLSDPQWVRSWPERLVTAGDVVWFYLGKLLWPHPLIFIYPRWQIDAGQPLSYVPLLAVIIVLSILWLNRKPWLRPGFFMLAYFIAALLPVLGLVDHFFLRYSFVGDHLQYLASMGPLALAGAGLVKFADFVISKKPWLQSSLCVGLLLALGVLSWQRAWVYQSKETLWMDTLVQNPNCSMAHNNLGNILIQNGRTLEAMDQYEQAFRLDPEDVEAHYNLASALLRTGRSSEAIDQFEQALRLRPDFAMAHYNLGDALFATNRLAEAIDQYRQALRVNPDYIEAHINLGNALQQVGQFSEAMEQYQQVLKINPNQALTRYNLAVVLVKVGQIPEAIDQYEQALKINPHFTEARNALEQLQAPEKMAPSKK